MKLCSLNTKLYWSTNKRLRCVRVCVCVFQMLGNFGNFISFLLLAVRTQEEKQKTKKNLPIFISIVILINSDFISYYSISTNQIYIECNDFISPSFVTLNRQRCVHMFCVCVFSMFCFFIHLFVYVNVYVLLFFLLFFSLLFILLECYCLVCLLACNVFFFIIFFL